MLMIVWPQKGDGPRISSVEDMPQDAEAVKHAKIYWDLFIIISYNICHIITSIRIYSVCSCEAGRLIICLSSFATCSAMTRSRGSVSAGHPGVFCFPMLSCCRFHHAFSWLLMFFILYL